jgi:hypothetical protein
MYHCHLNNLCYNDYDGYDLFWNFTIEMTSGLFTNTRKMHELNSVFPAKVCTQDQFMYT